MVPRHLYVNWARGARQPVRRRWHFIRCSLGAALFECCQGRSAETQRTDIKAGSDIQRQGGSLFSLYVGRNQDGAAGGQAVARRGFSPTVNRLRGYALLLVLVFHSGGMLDLPDLIHGETGVDIFLMISGYILAVYCVDTPTKVFLRRRFFRIFPAYWFALALFVSLEAYFSGVRHSLLDLGLHVVGLHGFARGRFLWGINDSFWFISIIVFCYCIFLGVRRHLHDLAFMISACSFLTAGLAIYYLWSGHLQNIPFMVPRVPDFFIGLMAGQLASGRGIEFRPGPLLAVALLLVAYVGVSNAIDGHDVVLALAFLCAYLCLEPVMERGAIGRLVLGLLGVLGTYSYELYLLHQPLMRNYSRMVIERVYGIPTPTQGQILAGMAAGFAVACVGAFLLHWLVEFVLNKRWNRRPTGAGEPGAATPTGA
jgi:peptidoglycan/LPS O-acetylase OafA/YrhL